MSCCFAVQDKVWVDGPDGEPWEIYTVLADAEHERLASCARSSPVPTRCAAAPLSDSRGPLLLREPRLELARQLTAEAVGTALLVAIVVGSGIAAQRLSPHDLGLELLESSTATGSG